MTGGLAARCGAVGIFVGSLFLTGAVMAADPDEMALRPGLVVTYRDTARPARAVVQLEPSIALALRAGEAPHPRLAADGGTAHWEGYLRILRPGLYRFTSTLRGRVRLTLAGKEMLAGEVPGDPALLKGPESRLEAGVHPLVAEFTRLPGSARLDLFWESSHFRAEPLHHDALAHLPAPIPAQLAADRSADLGRFLVEERSCIRCHRPDGGNHAARLVVRQGPDLSQVGRRVYAGWIYRWLEDPQRVRAGAIMPQLFSDDEAGRVERYAVAHYLASLGGPPRTFLRRPDAHETRLSIENGRRLYTSLGCITCHGPPDGKALVEKKEDADAAPGLSLFLALPQTHPLGALGNKEPADGLYTYLINPLAFDPSGRMPHMLLQHHEAEDLGRFLCQARDEASPRDLPAAPGAEALVAAFRRVESRPEELTAFRRLPAEARWNDLGKRLVIDKRCNACHTIASGGKEFATVLADASFEALTRPERQGRGCLAEKPGAEAKAPRFALSAAERRAIRAFLSAMPGEAGSPAPAHAARMTLQRFNCLACHSCDGAGGLAPQLVEQLRRYEKADNVEAITPPPLTGVGHKLRTPWLRQVLTQAGRARPWMGLRMPQFGEANVGHLPEGLAALEGAIPDEKIHEVPLTTAKIAAGRHLVGKSAFGCISCHDLAGIPNTGTRGPDLAGMNQRVRYEWYRRWLEQPQRYQPGTRMPTIFPEGKSLLPGVLGGSADQQAEAVWAYLALGSNLPLPEGMGPPPGLVLSVKDRPILLRTFMPDAGSRAVAVGFPGSISLAFDAATCRLAYSWSGNFLDAAPVWDGRGGNPARPLGARFWTAPPGCPWAVNTSNEPPDFRAQARDPAYGAALPEGQLYSGPRHLVFEGYHLDRSGTPAFHYRLEPDPGHPLEVSERPGPLHSPAGVGVARHFTLKVPAEHTPWLLAGEGQQPRVVDAKGMPVVADWKSGSLEMPAQSRTIVLPQGGGRSVVLVVTAAPEGTQWLLRRQSSAWRAILRLPTFRAATELRVDLHIWSPYRDELLPELIQGK
jgi:mono/diheme cytochrome c family protein